MDEGDGLEYQSSQVSVGLLAAQHEMCGTRFRALGQVDSVRVSQPEERQAVRISQLAGLSGEQQACADCGQDGREDGQGTEVRAGSVRLPTDSAADPEYEADNEKGRSGQVAEGLHGVLPSLEEEDAHQDHREGQADWKRVRFTRAEVNGVRSGS